MVSLLEARGSHVTDRGQPLFTVSLVFTVVATILVATRILTRVLPRRPLGYDDVAIIIALVGVPEGGNPTTKAASSLPYSYIRITCQKIRELTA